MTAEIKRDWYRMFDPEPAKHGCVRIEAANRAELLNQAQTWNRKGFGIFWTVNEFNGARQIANLARINAWVIDMDAGTKEEQRAKLNSSPLVPSLVVETRRGYQAYWNAKDGQPAHWNALVLERLVPFFGADKNARDLARILRVPGYLHLKDPTQPFPVKVVHSVNVAYTEFQVAEAFPVEIQDEPHAEHREATKREQRWNGSDNFWDQVYQLDCEEGLARLSGHPAVGGEHYAFKRTSKGNLNIIVDGKGTSAFIDKHKRIGSLSDGGPTLYNWLAWFRNAPGECAKVLKEIFPHLNRRSR